MIQLDKKSKRFCMGMYLGLISLSDENIESALAHPPLILRVVYPDDPQMYLAEVNEGKGSFFSRLFKKNKSHDIPSLEYKTGEGKESDLDKAWHGIHYLLTQSNWGGEYPLNFLLCAGKDIGDVDVGYGPARAINSREIKEISEALKNIDHAYLKKRYNPQKMTELEIYPDMWDDDEENLDYCLENFDELKSFVSKAARNSLGVVFYLG